MTKTVDAQGVVEALERRLGEALQDARSSGTTFASASVAVPVAASMDGPLGDPLATFARLADVDGVYWEQPSEEMAFAAMGCVADLAGGGGERFAEVQRRWRAAS